MRGEIDPGWAGGRLAIRVVAAAAYRKREVEDEDEEAVHGAADADAGCCCCGGGARRLAEVPSHTQNGLSPVAPAPAIPSNGATPPIVPVEEESARRCVRGWVGASARGRC